MKDRLWKRVEDRQTRLRTVEQDGGGKALGLRHFRVRPQYGQIRHGDTTRAN